MKTTSRMRLRPPSPRRTSTAGGCERRGRSIPEDTYPARLEKGRGQSEASCSSCRRGADGRVGPRRPARRHRGGERRHVVVEGRADSFRRRGDQAARRRGRDGAPKEVKGQKITFIGDNG